MTADPHTDGDGTRDRALRLQAILTRFRRVWAHATEAQKDRLLAVLEKVVDLTDRELASRGVPPDGEVTTRRPGPPAP